MEERNMKPVSDKIFVIFKFSRSGFLQAIFLNAKNQEDEKILQKSLMKFLRPERLGQLRDLFQK